MRRVGKGCSGVETLLFNGMLVARDPENQSDAEVQGAAEEHDTDNTAAEEPVIAVNDGAHFPMSLLQEALDTCVALTRRVEHLEHDKRIESSDDILMEDVSNQGRVIVESDKDEGAKLIIKEEEKETEEVRVNPDDAQVKGRQANIYHIDMDHATKVLSMKEDEPKIQEEVEGRMIDESDKDEGDELMNEKEEKETEEVRVNPDDAQVEGRQTDIYHIDMDHATKVLKVIAAISKTVSVVDVVQANVPTALTKTVNAAAVVTTAAPVKVVVLSTRRRRGVVIRDPEEESSYPRKVFANIRRVGKGCSGVETPLFEGMLVVREPEEQGDAEEQRHDDNTVEEPVTVVADVEDQTIQSSTPTPQQPPNIPSTSQVQSPPPQQQSPPPVQPQGADFPMSLLQEALDAC
nr:hypothetical protein [Tanacetum cinerariifolium]